MVLPFVGIAAICLVLYIIVDSIMPGYEDFPGLNNALKELPSSNLIDSVGWDVAPINNLWIQAGVPAGTSVETARRQICPMILDIAQPYATNKYDLEVVVRIKTLSADSDPIIVECN